MDTITVAAHHPHPLLGGNLCGATDTVVNDDYPGGLTVTFESCPQCRALYGAVETEIRHAVNKMAEQYRRGIITTTDLMGGIEEQFLAAWAAWDATS